MTIANVLRNPGSQGARRLAEALQEALAHPVRLIQHGSHGSTRSKRVVVNWGVSAFPAHFRQRELAVSNTPEAVANCQDKRLTLACLKNANVPSIEWTDGAAAAAARWLEEDGKIVVRHSTTGHSGAGIAIVRRGGAIPAAPLYTRYFRKHAEYRVHVAFGSVILIQQKRKRNGVEHNEEQALIRTHGNGWVFATQNLSCDERNYRDNITVLALAAANAIGANHCAVDILTNHEVGRNHDRNTSVVCEINSAPGIEAGSTKEAYTNAFAAWIKENM